MERLHRLEQQVQGQQELLETRTTEVLRAAANSEQQIGALTGQVQELASALAQLLNERQSPPAVPAPTVPAGPAGPAPPVPAVPTGLSSVSEPRVGVPERYGGDQEGCSPFVTNCSILIALQPHTFDTEQAKVAFMVNHLTGKARLWGTAEWERQTPACASFSAFAAELLKVFGPVARGPDAAGGLLRVRQGGRTAADYALEFRVRARQSQWNTAAQNDAFLLGLADYLKDELVSYELPSSLDGLIDLVLRLDQRIQSRRRERRWGYAGRRFTPRSYQPPERDSHWREDPEEEAEPMQVGEAGHVNSRRPAKGPTHQ